MPAISPKSGAFVSDAGQGLRNTVAGSCSPENAARGSTGDPPELLSHLPAPLRLPPRRTT